VPDHADVIANGGLFSAIIQATRPAAPFAVLIRPMQAADADAVLTIYQAGLDTGQASFESTAPDWEAFDAAKLPLHRHVAADAAGSAEAAGIWTIQSACSPRTPPACACMSEPGSAWSAPASGSAAITAGRATRCLSSAAALPPESADTQLLKQRVHPGDDVVADRADLLDA